jgi:O-antigen/teichoic acid export membrane protein
MLRVFLRDSAVYGVSTVLSRAVGLLLLPFYTRFLTAADLGAVELLTMLGNAATIVVALEVTQAVARFRAYAASEEERVAYASTGLWFTVGASAFFVLVGMAAAPAIAVHVLGPGYSSGLVRAAIVFFAVNAVLYFVLTQLRWELKPWRYAAASVSTTLVSVAGIVALIGLGGAGVAGIYYGSVIGAVLGAAIAWLGARHSFRVALDRAKLTRMLAFSAPLAASGLALLVALSVDRFVINALLDIKDVGVYAVAARFAGIVGLLLIGFQLTIVPLVTSRARDPQTPGELARMFRVFLTLALPIVVLLSALARELLVVFTTPDFYAGAHLIPLLAAGVLLAGAYPFAPGLWLAGKTVLALKLNLMVAAISLVLCVALVMVMGVTGAAAAALLTGLCAFALTFAISQRHYPAPYDWRRIGLGLALAVASVSAFAALYRLSGDAAASPRLVALRVALAAAVGCALFFTLLRRDERHALRQSVAAWWSPRAAR